MLAIDTTNVGASPAGNDITFSGTLNATTAAPSGEGLTLSAGTAGNILFGREVGATRLGDVSITGMNNFTASPGADITASSFSITGGGGTVITRSITTTGVTSATGSAGGTVTISTAGAVDTSAGTISARGGVVSAPNLGQPGGTVSITSTGSTVTVAAIDTTGSNGNTLGGGNAGNINLSAGGVGARITLNGSLTASGGAGAPTTLGTVTTAGTISPGGDDAVATVTIAANLNMAAGQYFVTLGPTSDQLAVTGAVTIGAGVAIAGKGAPSSSGVPIQIITSGVALATAFTPANTAFIEGRSFTVDYPAVPAFGVTLTALPTTWFWVGVAGNLWSQPLNWTSVSGTAPLNFGRPIDGDSTEFDEVNSSAANHNSTFDYLTDLTSRQITFSNVTNLYTINALTNNIALTNPAGGIQIPRREQHVFRSAYLDRSHPGFGSPIPAS